MMSPLASWQTAAVQGLAPENQSLWEGSHAMPLSSHAKQDHLLRNAIADVLHGEIEKKQKSK